MIQTHTQIVESIKGCFAVEGMSLSAKSLSNLDRLAQGDISCKDLVSEIMHRYTSERS